ncbi:phage antirepressor N-terminal domain-containing protein, partial [Avibacterium paragallinarum]|uniref:phage antirepressor N-terminal domain-containing protein n=1 Tax=Avibacterium paragallinarum TaxID=728 RepID=UPI00300E70A5
MKTQISTQLITFYGSELITLKVENVIYTAVRPIVEALGLSWSTQKRKLDNSISKFNCVHMNTVAEDGKIREMLCMPIRKLNGWLFSINPEKVRPDLKEKVICYQEECFEALYNYWNKGKAEKVLPTNENDTITPEEQRLIQNAVAATHQRTKMSYGEIWA